MFEKEIRKILRRANVRDIDIEIPPHQKFGDYSIRCFDLAKKYKKSPEQIALDLSKKIKLTPLISRVKPLGPYLNFFINKQKLASIVIKKVLKENDKYGATNIGKRKRILIEHTSINPNAAPHIGRARNALIGDSLAKIFKFQGYRPEVHYFVNDVGKQIAMLVFSCKDRIPSFKNFLRRYIEISNRMKKEPISEKKILAILYALEKGDRKIKRQFRRIVKVCLEGQKKILNELGIRYDFYDYESDYLWSKSLQKILNKLKKTSSLFRDEEGRFVLNQEELKHAMKSPYFVLTRSDGTSLYGLRDMAYTIDKLKRAKENIVVLGEDQKLYFQQLKSALNLLGYEAPRVIHYSFVSLAEGKMSTRRGIYVLLEDFMKKAVAKAGKEIKKRGSTNEKLAKIIGYGAIKYGVLRVSHDKNILFDWDAALSFEGETGPYIQYAHTRANSIIKKHGKQINNRNLKLLQKKEEVNLIKQVSYFSEVVLKASLDLKPHLIANYLYTLAQVFTEFYHNCQCISEDKALTNARLSLVQATRQTLKNGLNLLGIEAPIKM